MADTLTSFGMSERRHRQRFPVVAAVEYRVRFAGKSLAEVGVGTTVNLSGGGVLLKCKEPLPPASASVDVSIAWPVDLNQSVRLQLCGSGKAIRAENGCIAVRIQNWEFRTRKSSEGRYEAGKADRGNSGASRQRAPQ